MTPFKTLISITNIAHFLRRSLVHTFIMFISQTAGLGPDGGVFTQKGILEQLWTFESPFLLLFIQRHDVHLNQQHKRSIWYIATSLASQDTGVVACAILNSAGVVDRIACCDLPQRNRKSCVEFPIPQGYHPVTLNINSHQLEGYFCF